ncbi:DUF4189 domain-containing protein [Xanthomonas campestris pv. raphani]|uniref:DUF4189 domain-containing protein n=1 Tax=Xanthomonas campestris TaxID=339 RepID=UPI002B232A3D|nr:DUF4189 domain-containing protein [Xanthomonas campestris]MEA9755507.1 DUF4189 domain-containing protein [Xanthomonas campestris pv. raphani]MEA9957622.1 DUF4189 domain-containing protein [Xanthomonas campestris pv. raphani]MEA9961492.1 DUF4189 domain-containing protein [Xanthomonas campestris pv. raphani]
MNKAIIFFSLLLLAFQSFAEGNCPPGYYPIGGQGAAGCAPIPQGGGAGANSAPRATGKWLKTWGAVAGTEDGGDLGTASGKLSKRDAVKSALDMCGGESRGCKIIYTYRNGCIGMSQVIGGGVTAFEGGSDLQDAERNADNACKKLSGKSCKLIYSDCTDPVFKSF